MSSAACDRCHRRKSRCDRVVPSCGRCRKAGVSCEYATRDRQNQLDRLRYRVQQLERQNALLSEQLGNRSRHQRPAAATGSAEQLQHAASSNELAEEISFLSTRAGGENQFLGSTSGVLLANLVDATVKTSHSPAVGTVHRRDVMSPLAGMAVSNAPSEVVQLPDKQVARSLHDAYFNHDHLSYPFIHRPTALATVDKAYQDPSYFGQSAFAYYSFMMILAISTASGCKFDPDSLPNAENYHLRAIQRLNEILHQGSIEALQAVLLLCQYRMANSVQDTSTSMWHLVGVASRMCLELGLHREQEYRKDEQDQGLLVMNEIRRRSFWCVIAMDRIVSITLGRPLAIRLQDTDVALPDPGLDLVVNSDTPFDPSFAVTHCPTALFVHIVRYRVICGDIMTALHIGSMRARTDSQSALKARDELAETLFEWRRDISGLPLVEDEELNLLDDRGSSFRTRAWYEMLYYNALLMLYRPSPALSGCYSCDSSALQNIFVAARGSITLYAQLHRWKRINYTWITLHAVFLAGLSYIYAVGRHFRRDFQQGGPDTASLEKDPTIVDIVNDCRTCSNVLVAISERWNMAKNCYDVFNRLSDAVLADAVQYHTRAAGVGNAANIAQQDVLSRGPLAVDSALRACLDDLQHFQSSAYGDDPVGQLSHDWMGEIDGMGFNLLLYGAQAPV
ncbi:transcription factor domain-containing protein [Aspergillus stella-maris]|uniref:transcription factor domain-containing protein n=1 Tax=Aspergillus stella-maris TaxID=1810926 RepID=UPI003CCD733C